MRNTVSAWMAGIAAVLLGAAAHATAPVVRAAGMPTTREQTLARALPPAANVAPAGASAGDGLRRAFTVGGFRSAYFGMDEEQVRAAISRDFGLPGESILVRDNKAEGTSVLIVRTPLPPGPVALLVCVPPSDLRTRATPLASTAMLEPAASVAWNIRIPVEVRPVRIGEAPGHPCRRK